MTAPDLCERTDAGRCPNPATHVFVRCGWPNRPPVEQAHVCDDHKMGDGKEGRRDYGWRESTHDWDELFPEGRTVWYEGDDPEGFRAEMTAVGLVLEDDRYNEEADWCFDIPAGRVGEIYGSARWDIGS